MKLSLDDANTLALILESRSPISAREKQLYARVQKYFTRSLRARALKIRPNFAQDNLEQEKDQEEDKDGRYR